jgi:hypothetical protein
VSRPQSQSPRVHRRNPTFHTVSNLFQFACTHRWLYPCSDVLKRRQPDSHGDSDHPKRLRTVHEAAWLTELHSKIWGQKNRRQELFTTVEITTAHYKELEERLEKLHPNRHSETYEAQDVLSIKLEVLRSFKTPSNGGATHATHPDIESCEAEGESNEVDDELYSLFPFTVEFLDLSSLKLETSLLRMPQQLLVRQEYKFLTKRLPDRSAILSGQPGTGGMPVFLSHAESHPNTRQDFLPLHSNGRLHDQWSSILISGPRWYCLSRFQRHHNSQLLAVVLAYHCIR